MRRTLLHIVLMALTCGPTVAQEIEPAPQPLGVTRSMSIPLNGVQLFDQVMEAWTWTFGKEPGAKLVRSSREEGVLEGTARVNFRSKMLTGREETMGTISYTIHIKVRAGECRAVVSQFVHTGNTTTSRGGISMGRLLRDESTITTVRGLGHRNTVELHADLRETATARIETLLRTMESRIRANLEP